VRFAVGLAFADASIVVLALPQIVGELDTTISRSTWVIMSYNLALIAGVLAFLAFARHLRSRRALLAGLTLFGVASVGCALAGSLEALVAARCVQGVGGALLLCASLPLLAGASRPGESPTAGWAAAAAIGAAVGPAAGGLLTQAFDWRAIFIAQAPATALAVAAVLAVPVRSFRDVDEPGVRSDLGPTAANLALLLFSAGLIGALFLVVVLLINVWLLAPAAAAAVVSAIPIATVLVERFARGRSPTLLGAAGAILLAAGLAAIAFVTHRQIALVTVALAFCGAGLGLAFTALTAAAMSGAGTATVRAGRTVAARDAGLVLGLLVLTPLFVDDIDAAPGEAIPSVAAAVAAAPIPQEVKVTLGNELLQAYNAAPETRVPDLDPAFDRVRAQAGGSTAAELTALQADIESAVERAATRSFRRSFLFCAGFAMLVLPVLALRLRARPPRAGAGPQRVRAPILVSDHARGPRPPWLRGRGRTDEVGRVGRPARSESRFISSFESAPHLGRAG
jgi:predicted MFS family arabinose efflux permease